MNIVCLIAVPLFFVMISFYFISWMDADNFKRICAMFARGLLFGILYCSLSPLASSSFDGRIALISVFSRSMLIDGFLFGGLFTLTCIGLFCWRCPDDTHNKSASAVGAFGYLCGTLSVDNIMIFARQEYTDNILLYIPYILYILAVCAVVGVFCGLVRDADAVWKKLVFIPAGMAACGLLTGLYSFVSFVNNLTVWLAAAVCLGLDILFYMMDYRKYSDG